MCDCTLGQTDLPLLCEISAAVHLAQLGLMTDEIQVNFEVLKSTKDQHIRLFAVFNKSKHCYGNFWKPYIF